MINYNLKQHTHNFKTRRKRQAPKYMNVQVFISLSLSLSLSVSRCCSQSNPFFKPRGKMQKQKHNTIYNDIMYFPPASTHNTTPQVAKLNTQKYHTFISPSHLRPFLSFEFNPVAHRFVRFIPQSRNQTRLLIVGRWSERERVRGRVCVRERQESGSLTKQRKV